LLQPYSVTVLPVTSFVKVLSVVRVLVCLLRPRIVTVLVLSLAENNTHDWRTRLIDERDLFLLKHLVSDSLLLILV
jgi:hypothetical protein